MFIQTGGTYEEKDYSCMFDQQERYDNLSTDGTRYAIEGLCWDKGDDSYSSDPECQALLIFDRETDKLVYAEKCTYDRIAARMKEVLERKTA